MDGKVTGSIEKRTEWKEMFLMIVMENLMRKKENFLVVEIKNKIEKKENFLVSGIKKIRRERREMTLRLG